MIYTKADLMNRRAGNPRNNPDDIVTDLEIDAGMRILDLGTGGGYFAIRLSEATGPEGTVVAADTDPKMLSHLQDYKNLFHRDNIELLEVGREGIDLPEASLDLVFARHVYHHIEDPVAYFQTLRPAVKPGGRVVIIDWQPKKFRLFKKEPHSTSDDICRVMTSLGFLLEREEHYLKKQSFLIFKKSL